MNAERLDEAAQDHVRRCRWIDTFPPPDRDALYRESLRMSWEKTGCTQGEIATWLAAWDAAYLEA